MKLIITPLEELEELVQSSVAKSISNYYREKESKKNKSENLTVKEAATFLNVSELTIRNYIKRGFIKAERIGARILISRVNLEKSFYSSQ